MTDRPAAERYAETPEPHRTDRGVESSAGWGWCDGPFPSEMTGLRWVSDTGSR